MPTNFLIMTKNNHIINSLNSLSSACKELSKDKIFLEKYSLLLGHLIKTIKNDNTIFICGNGGSFADAQHLVTELVVRFTGINNYLMIIFICLPDVVSINIFFKHSDYLNNEISQKKCKS